MRLWTVHPQYLDPAGLVAAWREGLLARKVLGGRTRGYRHHPQLQRFRTQADPLQCIERYLAGLLDESIARGYCFDSRKIELFARPQGRIIETEGQLLYEWAHLMRKLRERSPALYRRWLNIQIPLAHPLFRIVPGRVRDWERAI